MIMDPLSDIAYNMDRQLEDIGELIVKYVVLFCFLFLVGTKTT